MKKSFAIVGHPLGHTMSPFIHRRLFETSGIAADYHVLDIAPVDLPQRISELSRLTGFNITIPHKQSIITFLDELDDRAKLYGSVNTVTGGPVIKGYNTDCIGFLRALAHGGITLGGNVAILGAGGVVRTFAYESAMAGACITLAVRPADVPAAALIAGEIGQVFPKSTARVVTLDALTGSFDLLINGTPVGMYPHVDASPVPAAVVRRCGALFEAVYNPAETMLMKLANAEGARVVGGMPMLVWQAAIAHEIWNGVQFDGGTVNAIIEEASAYMQKNFV